MADTSQENQENTQVPDPLQYRDSTKAAFTFIAEGQALSPMELQAQHAAQEEARLAAEALAQHEQESAAEGEEPKRA